MIVKNEEKMLERTLPNLVGLVDEVVLLDTGSTDRTVKIAEKLGARVFHFSWINDFSAARNESLKHARGEWILWADADEFIKAEDLEQIKAELAGSKEIAYLLKVAECHEGEFNPVSYNLRPKLFRNGLGIHFKRPINEQVVTAEEKFVVNLAKTLEIYIYHWGNFLSEDKLAKKKERNLALLKGVVERGGGDAAYHFLLGTNYRDLGMNEQALAEFDKVIKQWPNGEFVREARTEKAWLLYLLKRLKEAYQEAVEILKLDPENSTAWNVVGIVHLALGENEKAVEYFQRSIDSDPKDIASRVKLVQKEYIANLLLSRTYLRLGKKEEAFEAASRAYKYDATDEVKRVLEKAQCQ
jgi:glycosyltransferase involved in cell wall biosynthesis